MRGEEVVAAVRAAEEVHHEAVDRPQRRRRRLAAPAPIRRAAALCFNCNEVRPRGEGVEEEPEATGVAARVVGAVGAVRPAAAVILPSSGPPAQLPSTASSGSSTLHTSVWGCTL